MTEIRDFCPCGDVAGRLARTLPATSALPASALAAQCGFDQRRAAM